MLFQMHHYYNLIFLKLSKIQGGAKEILGGATNLGWGVQIKNLVARTLHGPRATFCGGAGGGATEKNMKIWA